MPRVVLSFISSCALVCLLLTPSVPARADDADALIKQGVELRREGKDGEALEQFRRAYELERTPRAVAQMALAEQALGRWVDAEAHIVTALGSSQDSWIAKYVPTLEHARATIAEHLGSLTVVGRPDGAEVRVDGQPVGTLPLVAPVRLPIGAVTVEVSSSGYRRATRAVTIATGQVAREDIALQPTTVADGEATAAPSPRDGAPRVTLVEGAPEPGQSQHKWATRAAWATGGLAVIGAAALVVGEVEARRYDNRSCPGGALDDSSCRSMMSLGNEARDVGVVGLVGAGVLGVTTLVLYLTAPTSSPESSGRLACFPDLTRPGAACALRF